MHSIDRGGLALYQSHYVYQAFQRGGLLAALKTSVRACESRSCCTLHRQRMPGGHPDARGLSFLEADHGGGLLALAPRDGHVEAPRSSKATALS
jgi:hypothetical protein